MTDRMKLPRRLPRPHRASPWSPLLVLGGSAVAATLLIQLSMRLASAPEPAQVVAKPADRGSAEAHPATLVAQAR